MNVHVYVEEDDEPCQHLHCYQCDTTLPSSTGGTFNHELSMRTTDLHIFITITITFTSVLHSRSYVDVMSVCLPSCHSTCPIISLSYTNPLIPHPLSSLLACLSQNSLPAGTAVERVTETVETAGFKSGFAEWSAATDFNFNKFNKDAVKKEDQSIDVQHLLSLKALESAPIDDGTGEQFT